MQKRLLSGLLFLVFVCSAVLGQMNPAELNNALKAKKNADTKYIKNLPQASAAPESPKENNASGFPEEPLVLASVSGPFNPESAILQFFDQNGFLDDSRSRDELEVKLDAFVDFEAAYWLVTELNKYIEARQSEHAPFSEIKTLKANLDVLKEHLDYIVSETYQFYNHSEADPNYLKSIYLFHDNDVFMFSGKNRDRDYTGGFRFEFTTDMLKMRLFRKALNGDDVMSYQSFLIGGEAYTPHIRFTDGELRNAYKLPLTTPVGASFYNPQDLLTIQSFLTSNQEKSDRPFASFQYFGRGKYRLHNRGHWRSKSFFKLGKVGGDLGKNIQAVIHQDFTVGSQRVLNWERQIAQGGRIAANTETQLDLMLVSQRSTIFRHSGYFKEDEHKAPRWLNLYTPVEWAFGTVNTYLGAGLGFSTHNFIDLSGHNDLKLTTVYDDSGFKRFFKSAIANAVVSLEWKNRYVIHNSMLEGLGIWNAFEDDPLDDEAITVYKLREDEVSRLLSTLNLSVSFRLKKMTVGYTQSRFITKEFDVAKGSRGPAQASFIPEFTTPGFYGYGRLALNFML